MPFLAQGGSSVVTNWIIVALLIRVSDSRARPAAGRDREALVIRVHPAGRRSSAPCCWSRCWSTPPGCRSSRPTPYDANPANRRPTIARYGQPRGDILVDGRPVTGSRDTGEQLRYERTYTRRPVVRAGDRLRLAGVRDDAAGEHRGRRALRHRPDARRRSRCGTTSPAPGTPAASVVTTLNRAAQRAAFAGLGAAPGRGRRASSRRPAGSWRWSPPRRTTPGRCPGTGRGGRRGRGPGSTARRTSRCSTGRSGRRIRRVRRSRSSPRRRRWTPGVVDGRGRADAAPRTPTGCPARRPG